MCRLGITQGLGSFVWTTLGRSLLSTYGMSVYGVQATFAGIFFCLLLVACPILRLPPPKETGAIVHQGVQGVQGGVESRGRFSTHVAPCGHCSRFLGMRSLSSARALHALQTQSTSSIA
jgi:hypothetical protein